jgi:hypothetical protein
VVKGRCNEIKPLTSQKVYTFYSRGFSLATVNQLEASAAGVLIPFLVSAFSLEKVKLGGDF